MNNRRRFVLILLWIHVVTGETQSFQQQVNYSIR